MHYCSTQLCISKPLIHKFFANLMSEMSNHKYFGMLVLMLSISTIRMQAQKEINNSNINYDRNTSDQITRIYFKTSKYLKSNRSFGILFVFSKYPGPA